MRSRRRPRSSQFHALDTYLLDEVPSTQQQIVLPFRDLARLLAPGTPFSAITVERAFLSTTARTHWLGVGFALAIDWLDQRVVFTRLAAAADSATSGRP